MAARLPRLYVLPPSHYCERARWGLDHAGIAFAEERWAVGLHVVLARRLAEKSTLPILDTGTNIIQGSDRILDWAGLHAGDPEVERRFGDVIGPLIRQYIYAVTLSDPSSGIRALLLEGVPTWQRRVARLMWPATCRLMVAHMNADARFAHDFERRITAELDWFSRRIGDRAYLSEDRFSRTDITAASLLAPLARPEFCRLYRRLKLPPVLTDAFSRWQDSPALHWTTRIYALHRGTASSF
jgi:hypothetical protein